MDGPQSPDATTPHYKPAMGNHGVKNVPPTEGDATSKEET